MKSPVMTKTTEYLQHLIREIPDFPKPGILFYDITTLLKDANGLHLAVEALTEPFINAGIDLVIGIEARGFIFAAMVAYRLQAGFIPVRKPNKLPAKTTRTSYAMEYGEQTLEMHQDAIHPGKRILIVDDLLATGGTAKAVIDMTEAACGQVAALAFLIELQALQGKNQLNSYSVHSVLKY
ncbi:MAG TPA: adenine phosphoribosyltransferase [Gammaproteobacteria bacterium]|nr:adenine phosphoribosyltransferase [Gammaproteobacteria bacterium]